MSGLKVIAAKTAGFCYGVQRAVSMCAEAADKYPGCLMLGPIIHNERVISELTRKGVGLISKAAEVPSGGTVVIRSHGVAKSEYDTLQALGANIIDATCPDVRRIHDIAREKSQEGRLLVIIGEQKHPEVMAIAGWCGDCEVFEGDNELAEWLSVNGNSDKPLSFVFQTTNSKTLYDSCVELVKKECTNWEIFDTICDATCKRQQEAADLSKTVDVMVVTGGRNSANSLRLANICREYCSRVIFAEGADDIDFADIRVSDTVGITAGASTPAWIIKEVILKMSEEIMFDENTTSRETQDIQQEQEATTVLENEDPAACESPAIVPVETAEVSEHVFSVSDEPSEPHDLESNEATEQPQAVAAGSDAVDESDTITGPDASVEPDSLAQSDAELDEDPMSAQDTLPYPDAETSESSGETYSPAVDIITEDVSGQASDLSGDAADSETEAAAAGSESFAEMLEKSIKTLHTGEKVTGIVTSITSTEVSVDLGTKQSGYIPISEFTDDSNSNIDDIIKIGDSIETFVMRVNDIEGMVMLSKKRLDAIRNWDDIEAARESKAVVEGIITEENKGGVVANVKGVRVFIPASQTGLPKSTPMTELLRKNVRLRVTEVNQSRRRVVGSIRIVQSEERREKSEQLWNDIEVGKQYDGVVKSMTSYGVFVDIGGVDGMIHISELSWTRIKQPSEVMSVGDEVSVYVLSFDKDNRKISLGYKKHEDNPWTKFVTNNSIGDVVNVRIVKMMPFGAFAEIYPGVDGLIHISQITDHRIGLPSEVLSDGQLVDVKITEIDTDRKKVSLSIRALIDPSSQPVTDKEANAAAETDNTPVIVYDTDAPMQSDLYAAEAAEDDLADLAPGAENAVELETDSAGNTGAPEDESVPEADAQGGELAVPDTSVSTETLTESKEPSADIPTAIPAANPEEPYKAEETYTPDATDEPADTEEVEEDA